MSSNNPLLSLGWFRSISLIALLFGSFVVGQSATTIAIAPGPGHIPVVRIVVDGRSGDDAFSLLAYPTSFRGGVRVAVGDVNGDGVADIVTAPGPGAAPHIKVFDGRFPTRRGSLLMSFNAFPGFFRGGVFVAAGDVNGDGRADIIAAPDSGAPPIVRVFDGRDGGALSTFFAYGPTFTGGVRVATGDVNGDGLADIITGAGAGGGPHVKIFNSVGIVPLASFFAFEPNFLGGVFVGAVSVPTPPR